jgi:hypothetical protein
MRATVIAVLLCAAAALVPTTAGAAGIRCQSPTTNLFEVTSATNVSCRRARADLEAYEEAAAISFRTPGGYVCTRTSKRTREQRFRCVKGNRRYRATLAGRIRSAVRVHGRSYDKVFRLSRCESADGSGLTAGGRGWGGVRLSITPPPGASVIVTGGSEQDSIDARGDIATLEIGDDGTFTGRGTWVEGLDGTFRLEGECV